MAGIPFRSLGNAKIAGTSDIPPFPFVFATETASLLAPDKTAAPARIRVYPGNRTLRRLTRQQCFNVFRTQDRLRRKCRFRYPHADNLVPRTYVPSYLILFQRATTVQVTVTAGPRLIRILPIIRQCGIPAFLFITAVILQQIPVLFPVYITISVCATLCQRISTAVLVRIL